MSRAFDTIIRSDLLTTLKSIITKDNWRIVQKLITNTSIKVSINNQTSRSFITNIGAPQGDSLSPVLFTIYLESALREIRKECVRTSKDKMNPTEICYADDTDFISRRRNNKTN